MFLGIQEQNVDEMTNMAAMFIIYDQNPGAPGVWGSWGGSTNFWGFSEHCQKVKKNKYQASILFDSLKFGWPPYITVINFQFL